VSRLEERVAVGKRGKSISYNFFSVAFILLFWLFLSKLLECNAALKKLRKTLLITILLMSQVLPV